MKEVIFFTLTQLGPIILLAYLFLNDKPYFNFLKTRDEIVGLKFAIAILVVFGGISLIASV